MLGRIQCKNRKEWLEKRQAIGIGASEAAATCGLSPWMTTIDLWNIKTGKTKPKDLSGNELIEKGNRFEIATREIFKANHPEYKVEHHPFDILYQEERPWLFSTLDGEISFKDKSKPLKGVFEAKYSEPRNSEAWKQWENGVPQHYYIQVLHQLLSTGYDFVHLAASLRKPNGDIVYKERDFFREDLLPDLNWLLDAETEFHSTVVNNVMPPIKLTL